MDKHSPGPWYFHQNAADYVELRTAAPGNPIIAQWGEWPELSRADAELIRAAPEMLSLLRESLALDDDHRDIPRGKIIDLLDELEKAFQ